jgi:hypothetical protein
MRHGCYRGRAAKLPSDIGLFERPTMSMWRNKSEARLQSLLAANEVIVRTGDGLVGWKGAFFALTNKRIFIFCIGVTVASAPKMAEINLEHVISAHCDPGLMTKGPTLVIKSRSGSFSVILAKAARKESGMWPKWILEAQSALTSQPQPLDDVVSQLARLAALHESKALTSAEYAAAKSRILGSSN